MNNKLDIINSIERLFCSDERIRSCGIYARCLLSFFNISLFVLSFLFLILWGLLAKNVNFESFIIYYPITFLIFAVILIILGVLGCYALSFLNKIALAIYAALVGLLFLAQLLTFIHIELNFVKLHLNEIPQYIILIFALTFFMALEFEAAICLLSAIILIDMYKIQRHQDQDQNQVQVKYKKRHPEIKSTNNVENVETTATCSGTKNTEANTSQISDLNEAQSKIRQCDENSKKNQEPVEIRKPSIGKIDDRTENAIDTESIVLKEKVDQKIKNDPNSSRNSKNLKINVLGS